jgi:hypothetical protein
MRNGLQLVDTDVELKMPARLKRTGLRKCRVQSVIGRSQLYAQRLELFLRSHPVEFEQKPESPSQSATRKMLYVLEE